MKRVIYWWNETEQGPRYPEEFPIMNFPDDATQEEIDETIRQTVFDNFEWGYDVEETKGTNYD
ncbi:hypothetical protein [Liquorilactobacillus satsumensis]|uniref:hypothetical protein n=1 Tax=Liquorilactobacillus satsumensis TaxID=259059 RepID=UPI001E6144E3|nr:hypothetical protein [Liquorilactobacillus satsumensis]MCC7667451.1 hypothetical protein [Liquorilactobacillus satsumensis]